jgi:hypothetical protein
MTKTLVTLGLTALIMLPAQAAETVKSTVDRSINPTSSRPGQPASTSISDSPTKTLSSRPIRWTTLPQTSQQNPLVLQFCATKVIRVATSGGWGDVNLVDFSAGEKWGPSNSYDISSNNWSLNKVSSGGSPNYLNPQPTISTPSNTPAADVIYDIRRKNNVRPSVVSGFGAKSFKKEREGRMIITMRDSQNQSLSGTTYYEYRLHRGLIKVDPPKIEKLVARKNFPTHRFSFQAALTAAPATR